MSDDSVRVDTGDLHGSAGAVNDMADTVAVRHSAADGRVGSAMPGQVGKSAAAIGAAAAKWQQDTAALVARLSDHGAAMRTGATAYENTDEAGASNIDLTL